MREELIVCLKEAILGCKKKVTFQITLYVLRMRPTVNLSFKIKSDPKLICCSCISWSSYHKNLLASSDYEGTVILWDGFTGQRSKVYQVSYLSL